MTFAMLLRWLRGLLPRYRTCDACEGKRMVTRSTDGRRFDCVWCDATGRVRIR